MVANFTSAALPPLCVDLDETLVKTDLLHETLLILLKRAPLAFLAIPGWLIKGRAYLKHQVALRTQMEVAHLPYRTELVEFLRLERARGRRLVLVTAADRLLAARVQEHLQLFDEVIASDGSLNLKGSSKAQLLEKKFGKQQFDYVGDSHADFAVWRGARRAVVVSDSKRFVAAINSIVPVETVFPKTTGRFRLLLKACRPHQWAKNVLVFVPILTSHRLTDSHVLLQGALAFFSFGFIASSVYLLNDTLDLEADRVHAIKRSRALAAGQISVPIVVGMCLFLFVAGAAIGTLCGAGFLFFAALYLGGNVVYSIWLKRVVMLDVVVLACFYTLRLLAGGAATGIGCSDWLLAFSVFFFFCLAMVKRYSELRELGDTAAPPGRGYLRTDLESIGTFGVSSGLISVVVLVLYVMSPEVRILYQKPTLLLLLCPLFLYWITRLWVKANRGEVPQDPVVFALTDRTSYVAGVLAALVLYAATI